MILSAMCGKSEIYVPEIRLPCLIACFMFEKSLTDVSHGIQNGLRK